MDLRVPEQEKAFRDEVRTFLEESLTPEIREAGLPSEVQLGNRQPGRLGQNIEKYRKSNFSNPTCVCKDPLYRECTPPESTRDTIIIRYKQSF